MLEAGGVDLSANSANGMLNSILFTVSSVKLIAPSASERVLETKILPRRTFSPLEESSTQFQMAGNTVGSGRSAKVVLQFLRFFTEFFVDWQQPFDSADATNLRRNRVCGAFENTRLFSAAT